jgi:hypothetical protein
MAAFYFMHELPLTDDGKRELSGIIESFKRLCSGRRLSFACLPQAGPAGPSSPNAYLDTCVRRELTRAAVVRHGRPPEAREKLAQPASAGSIDPPNFCSAGGKADPSLCSG